MSHNALQHLNPGDAAFLSDYVYSNRTVGQTATSPDGTTFIVIGTSDSTLDANGVPFSQNGYYGIAVQDQSTGLVTFVHRGMEGSQSEDRAAVNQICVIGDRPRFPSTPAVFSFAAAPVTTPIAPTSTATQPIFIRIAFTLGRLVSRTLSRSLLSVKTTSQQDELVFITIGTVARPARLPAPRPPP